MSEKKKILIATRDLNIGGVQNSLVLFLKKIEQLEKDIQVDLLLLDDSGENKKNIPQFIKIIKANKKFLFFGISQQQAKNKGYKIKRGMYALFCKLFGNKILIKRAIKKQKYLGEYDLAMSYATSLNGRTLYSGFSELMLEKCKAKQKICYIHNDFCASGLNNPYVLNLLEKFDKILFVSNSCEKDFVRHFPSFKNKTGVQYNFIDSEKILVNSKLEKIEFDKTKFNIVSVLRLSPEKGILRTLSAIKRLNEVHKDYVWHIVGEGPERTNVENYIKNNNINNVVLYGQKENPYPYIKEADLFFLGSKNESFGLVLCEALTLGVPILTTKTISAKEIVGKNGFICENSEEGIYKRLNEILSNRNLLKEKNESLNNYVSCNKKANDQLIQVLDLK